MEKNKLLINNIDRLIAEAMKNKDKVRLESLKLIKASLVKAQKDGINIDEVAEGKIIKKMIKQSEDAIEQFKNGNRNDLVEEESLQLEVFKEFAPVEVSEEEIKVYTNGICQEMNDNGIVVDMKKMRDIMVKVQTVYTSASGKIISEVVKNWVNK